MAANARVFPFGQGFLQMQKDLNRIPVRYSQGVISEISCASGLCPGIGKHCSCRSMRANPRQELQLYFPGAQIHPRGNCPGQPGNESTRNWQPPLRFPTGSPISHSGFQQRRQAGNSSPLEATNSSPVNPMTYAALSFLS